MLKEITRNDVLNVLRRHEIYFSKNIDSNILTTLERKEWNEDAEESESFDVEVRFSHPNYIYLLLELYGADKNTIRDGNLGVNIFDLVPRIKTVVEQLQDDGYVKIGSQKCSFHTEFGKETIYQDFDGDPIAHPFERYINAEARFSKDELLVLNSSITLTTKGQSGKLFFKERFLSEPIGSISLITSVVAVLVSILALFVS
jgi:hypothetical protein